MQQPEVINVRPSSFPSWIENVAKFLWRQICGGNDTHLSIQADRALITGTGQIRLRVQIIRDFIISSSGSISVLDSSSIEDNRNSLEFTQQPDSPRYPQQHVTSRMDHRLSFFREHQQLVEVTQLLNQVRLDLDNQLRAHFAPR